MHGAEGMGEQIMLHIGCHLSCSNGYLAMGKQAVTLGADTFQFFTRNPRGGSVKPFDAQDAAALVAFMEERSFAPVLAHAPYTLNACAADASIREFARRTMREDLERLNHIPGAMLNFHPGSHVKQGAEVGVRLIAQMLDEVYTPDIRVPVLLETMSGKGSEVGRNFEELPSWILPKRGTGWACVWIPAMCTMAGTTSWVTLTACWKNLIA